MSGAGPSGPGGRSRGGKVRVKTARKRTPQSAAWLERHLNDPYVAAAKAQGYRSLMDLFAPQSQQPVSEALGALQQQRQSLFDAMVRQVVKQKRPKARVVGMDLLAIEPLAGVDLFQKDITDDDSEALILSVLGGPADLVMSDMAANTVGHKQTDHLRTMGLIEVGLDMATRLLRPGGSFLAKVLAGGGDGQLTALLKRHFTTVKHVKPPASRKGSSEWYVVAQGFKAIQQPVE